MSQTPQAELDRYQSAIEAHIAKKNFTQYSSSEIDALVTQADTFIRALGIVTPGSGPNTQSESNKYLALLPLYDLAILIGTSPLP